MYGASWLIAPLRQRNEARGKLIIQRGDERHEEILTFLSVLREEGVRLRNEGVERSNTEDIETWNTSVGLWRGQVIAQIQKISPVEAKLYETLDWFDAPDFGIEDRGHHLRVRIIHGELRNLKAFIDKHLGRQLYAVNS